MLELGYCAYTCLAPLKGLGRKGGSITKKHVLYIYIYDICSMSMYMYIYIYAYAPCFETNSWNNVENGLTFRKETSSIISQIQLKKLEHICQYKGPSWNQNRYKLNDSLSQTFSKPFPQRFCGPMPQEYQGFGMQHTVKKIRRECEIAKKWKGHQQRIYEYIPCICIDVYIYI